MFLLYMHAFKYRYWSTVIEVYVQRRKPEKGGIYRVLRTQYLLHVSRVCEINCLLLRLYKL